MAPRCEEHAPDAALAAHVHCLWRFVGAEDGAEQAIPPDGRCELIAHGGRPYDERGADGAWHAQAKAHAPAGLKRTPSTSTVPRTASYENLRITASDES